MTLGFNSGVPYPSGGRPALKLSAYVLDDQAIFNAHKARVLADGGVIPDEAGCMARITWLLDNGIYGKVESAINPAFGVKMNANKEVSKLYSLFANDDYISVMQGDGAQVLYDDSGDAPGVIIKISSNGGAYLRSEKTTACSAVGNMPSAAAWRITIARTRWEFWWASVLPDYLWPIYARRSPISKRTLRHGAMARATAPGMARV